MSLFGALNTAVSGLTAQSTAFGNISDNVANSQSVGYKGVNTNFIDYLTTSTATTNTPGSVVATPQYTNDVQGTITQSADPLAMAISGGGFFAVAESQGGGNSAQTSFNSQTYYTRAGDFSMNNQGYLVNSAGEYLEGWVADPTTGNVNGSQLQPIQVSKAPLPPTPTSSVSLSANLPATPAATTPVSSQVQVYDSQGTMHTLNLSWTPAGGNSWGLNVTADGSSTSVLSTTVQFGPTGTIAGIGGTSGTAGQTASIPLSVNLSQGAQKIALNLGTFGQSGGLTQFAGTSYSVQGISQNGLPTGNYTGTSVNSSGDVLVTYDNGQSVKIAQVPLTTFAAPDALQRQNGQAFTATLASGTALTQSAGSNGSGSLVAGSVEESNVDIATQFSQLIVAQQAYGANAKMVTSADQLLQTTINMKQ